MCKSIRVGDWKLEQIIQYAQEKELALEKLVNESKLQEKPRIDTIRTLLVECLESHYGSLDKFIGKKDMYRSGLIEISQILDRFKL